MKALCCSCVAASLAVLGFAAVRAETPAPLAIPPAATALAPAADVPAIAPTPGGTSVAGTVGLTVYNNAVYLVRDTVVIKLDASTIPTGHMMTLDGRIVPLPAGTQFPQVVAPKPGTGAGGTVQSNVR